MSCRCRRVNDFTQLKPGDEVHSWSVQGFVLNKVGKGERPFILLWRNRYGTSGERYWKFEGCEQMSWGMKHRKTNPMHLDFRREPYSHD